MTDKQAIRYLRQILGRVPCQFWACEGPRREPEHMKTCYVCWALYDTAPSRIRSTKP